MANYGFHEDCYPPVGCGSNCPYNNMPKPAVGGKMTETEQRAPRKRETPEERVERLRRELQDAVDKANEKAAKEAQRQQEKLDKLIAKRDALNAEIEEHQRIMNGHQEMTQQTAP